MRLAEVRLEELKGQTAIHALPARALLVGPSGSGKSAVLQGISVAVLGYDPRLGKLPPSTMGLASSDTMVAGVTFEEGEREFRIDRVFVRRGDGGAKLETALWPTRGEKTRRACETRIKKEVGDVATMIDLASFLGLTPG